MAKKHVVTGIDVGTYSVRAVIAELDRETGRPKIIGTGLSESRGLRHGYIVNIEDTARSIRSAVEKAERASGERVRRAYLSAGGVGLDGVVTYGSVIVSQADGVVNQLDIEKATSASESRIPGLQNKKIIHSIPLGYRLDGKEVLGRPEGMKGTKLEVKILFITALGQHISDLIQSASEAGVEVDDVAASPLAASFVTLTKQQKTAGCVLANIGAETVSVVVFENNLPMSLKVFPIGSTDITNDLALGMKISLDEAEKLKLSGFSGHYPKKKVEEIIDARLTDIFELIDAHLKELGRNGLLPAGVVITGGGSGITTIEDMAKAALKLPSKVVGSQLSRGAPSKEFKDAPLWSVAYGLCILSFSAESEESVLVHKLKRVAGSAVSFVKQFLP